jgi:hypothetical protein
MLASKRILAALIAVIVLIALIAFISVLVSLVLIALIIVAGVSLLYLPMILPKTTSLTISPLTFALSQGESMALTATPKSNRVTLTGASTTWAASIGTFDRASGSVVIYTAPEVPKSKTVSITASFPGERPYRPSRATITGTVMPREAAGFPGGEQYMGSGVQVAGTVAPSSIKEFSYELRFEKLTVNNAELKGPVVMLGSKIIEITGGQASVTKLTLNPLGLTVSGASFENMRMYVIHLKAFSPELGKELELVGDRETKMSMSTLTLERGTATVIYIAGASVGLTKPELVGKNVGGDEPYTPVIATAHKAILDQGYSVLGPTTYEKLVNRVNNLLCGRIMANDFTFACPLNYSLDRQTKETSYKTKWTMSASELTGQNPSIFFVYFATTYGGIVMKGTGDQSASTIIPHGFSAGWKSPPLPDPQVHAVYFTADQLALKNLVIQITP